MREDCTDDERIPPVTRMSDNVSGQPFVDEPNGREHYRIACVAANVPPVSQFLSAIDSENLSLARYGMGPRGLQALVTVLPFRSKLEHLNLADNNLHGPCLVQLFGALEKNKTVRILDISQNKISADVVPSFERYLSQQCSLTWLNLSATQLDDRSGASLCRSLNDGLLKLQSLNLSRNHLSNRTALALSHYLEKDDALVSLNLAWNLFGAHGFAALCQALKSHRTMRDLDVSWNGLKDNSISALAEALSENEVLTQLVLHHTGMTDIGLSAFCEGVCDNNGLIAIDLSNNNVTEQSAAALLAALSTNTGIRSLKMHGTLLSIETQEKLVTLLQSRNEWKPRSTPSP